MIRLMTRLPPFDALVAFEAAARLESMTRAAHELRLTQSAVSHRIKRLETFMGVPLMLRQHQGLVPTPAGEAVLAGLSELLDSVANLRARCQAVTAPRRLRLGVGAGLADHWLVRRLPDFMTRHPNVSVELVVVENEAPDRVGDLDVRILWMRPEDVRATPTQQPLFQEHVFPVCHPSLLPADFVADDPSVLTRLPLLYKGTAGYQAGEEWSWLSWFERLGLPAKPRETLRFASIGPAIAAALGGAGVVLARTMLVSDALADARLVRLLPEQQDRLSSKAHVVRWPARLSGDDRLRGFVSWLIEKARETAVRVPA
jgi:LysR family glycine cleavage system transcriptional activator